MDAVASSLHSVLASNDGNILIGSNQIKIEDGLNQNVSPVIHNLQPVSDLAYTSQEMMQSMQLSHYDDLASKHSAMSPFCLGDGMSNQEPINMTEDDMLHTDGSISDACNVPRSDVDQSSNKVSSNMTTSDIKDALMRSMENGQDFFQNGEIEVAPSTSSSGPILAVNAAPFAPQLVAADGSLVVGQSRGDKSNNKKTDLPPPPKKPLSPYMRFSKGIWQQVKLANPGFSVCEVGATIGRVWRELSDMDKARYNDEFLTDKIRYDAELQNYLKMTGLQPSDLVKPRGKKKEPKEKTASSRQGKAHKQNNSAANAIMSENTDCTDQNNCGQVMMGGQNISSMANSMDDGCCGVFNGQGEPQSAGTLPPFSQVWSNTEYVSGQDLLAEMAMTSHIIYNHQGENDAQRLMVPDNRQQNQAIYSNQGHTFITENSHPTSQQNANGHDPSLGLTTCQSDTNNWMWQQFNNMMNQQCEQPVTENHVNYQYQSPSKNNMSKFGTNVKSEVLDAKTPTSQPQHEQQLNDARMQNQQFHDMSEVSRVDTEMLRLRGSLVEKSQEVLRLMKELEQAYGLIHQLKQQNDFFHQQWNLLNQHHQLQSLPKSKELSTSGTTNT